MLDFLPEHIQKAVCTLNTQYLYELRIRANSPIMVNLRGEYQYLGLYGIVKQVGHAIIATIDDVNECVYRAGKYSIYAVEEQIKKGFITTEHGERIGLSGEFVFEKGQPVTLRNYMSICVRIPHDVRGCGDRIYCSCMRDKVRNLLIMSAPGLGKTTILRDLSRQISEKTLKNILVCDERGEISSGKIGKTCDVIKFAEKSTSFEVGIRALRPDVLITDELSVSDCHLAKKVINAGVNVVATAHVDSFELLPSEYVGIFERYVLLEKGKIGVVKMIYDEKGCEVCSYDC